MAFAATGAGEILGTVQPAIDTGASSRPDNTETESAVNIEDSCNGCPRRGHRNERRTNNSRRAACRRKRSAENNVRQKA